VRMKRIMSTLCNRSFQARLRRASFFRLGSHPRLLAAFTVVLVLPLSSSLLRDQEPTSVGTEVLIRNLRSPGVTRPHTLRLGPDGRLWISFPAEGVFRVVDVVPGNATERVVSVTGMGMRRLPSGFGFSIRGLWAIGDDSSVLVWMDLKGQVLESQHLQRPNPHRASEVRPLGVRGVTPDGNLIWRTAASFGTLPGAPGTISGAIEPPSLLRLPAWRTDTEGNVLSELFTHSGGRDRAFLSPLPGDRQSRAALLVVPQPFTDDDLWSVSPFGDRFALAERRVPESGSTPSFRVIVLTLTGDTVFSRAYPYSPVPISRDVLEMEIRAVGARLSADSLAGQEAARLGLFLPQTYPPVTGLRLDSEGWVWVRCEDVEGEEEVRWMILDPEGQPRATAILSKGLTLGAVRGTQAWGYRQDPVEGVSIWYIEAEEVGTKGSGGGPPHSRSHWAQPGATVSQGPRTGWATGEAPAGGIASPPGGRGRVDTLVGGPSAPGRIARFWRFVSPL
jgi:hypothetical protein